MSSATQFFPGAFSMGKSQRPNPYVKSDNPGPGSYQHQEENQAPKWQFKKGKRKPAFKQATIPPPGQYNIVNKVIGPSYSIPKQVEPSTQQVRLGPGYYNTASPQKTISPAYTFMSRFDDAAKESLKFPGPGTYDYQSSEPDINKSRLYGFGSAIRQSAHNISTVKNPGPGSYNIKLDKAPAIRFTQSNRDLNSTLESPGPGSFDILTSMLTNKGSSFAQKNYHSPQNYLAQPGPGSYKPQSFLDDLKGIKIGTSQRLNMGKADNGSPSPFDYQIEKTLNPFPSQKAKFGTAQRKTFDTNMKTPGPGNYNLPDTSQYGPKAVIPQAVKQSDKSMATPGPGNYEINDSFVSGKSPSYPLQGKNESKSTKSILGPGRYNLQRNESYGPKFSFGYDEKLKEDQSRIYGPGVGNYDLKSSLGSLPSYHKSKNDNKRQSIK